MSEAKPPVWREVNRHDYGITDRLEIPGGWIYRTQVWASSETPVMAVAMVFVPFKTALEESQYTTGFR